MRALGLGLGVVGLCGRGRGRGKGEGGRGKGERGTGNSGNCIYGGMGEMDGGIIVRTRVGGWTFFSFLLN